MRADLNPYSPPRAPVADFDGDATHPRPRVINVAVTLMAIGLTISMIEQFDLSSRNQSLVHAFMGIVWPLVKFGVSCWICVQIARGRNWARWALLVATAFVMLAVAALFATAPQGVKFRYDMRLWRVAIELLPVLLYLVSVCLLFGPGRAWFRPRR